MNKLLNQYVFSPLFWLMTILLIILLVLVLSLFTPFGPKVIANIADASIEKLSLTGVSGSVLTGLHVDELMWRSEVEIVVKNIDLSVDKYDIQNKKIYADKLSVDDLIIVLPEKKNNENKKKEALIPNFGLPINIVANQLKLNSLQILRKLPLQESQTQLFQIEGILLKDTNMEEGRLNFGSLDGSPTILKQPLKISVENGSLNMNQPHEMDTSGKVSFDHPELGNLSGSILVGGTLTEYELSSALNFEQKDIGFGSLKVKGAGNYKKVTLEEIFVDTDHGKAKADGSVSWDPEIRLTFDVEGNELNTEALLPEWPITEGTTSLRYKASYLDSRLESQVDIFSLNANIRDQKLSGEGRITARKNLVRTENINFILGDNKITTTGAITEPLNLELQLDAKNLNQLLPKLSGSAKGSVSIKGSYKAPQIKSTLSANQLVYGEIKQGEETLYIDTEIGLEDDVFTIKEAIAQLGENTVKLNGKASEPFDLKWDIKANDLLQISPLISGQIDGSGILKGTPKALASTLDIKINDIEYNELRQNKDPLYLKGEVELNESSIQLKSLLAKSGTNSITLSGLVSDPVDLIIKIEAPKLDEVSPDIGGRITGTAEIKGGYSSPTIITNLHGDGIAFKGSSLDGAQLKLEGEVIIKDGIPIVKQLNTQIGENTIQVSGRASSPFNLTWNIDSKKLRQISPELSGSVFAKGKLQGTIEKPIINAIGDIKNIKYNDLTVNSANFNASTRKGIYSIKADLKDLKNGEQKVPLAKLELNGTIDNHAISALVDHSETKLNLQANGGWKNPRWKGIVKTLKFSETKAGDWQLKSPAKVSLSKSGFSTDKVCFGSIDTHACSTASYSKTNGLIAKGNIQKTSLALLKPFIPENIILNGDVTGSYDIKQNNGKPVGMINLKLPKSSFSIKGEDDEIQSFSYEDSELKATINNRVVSAEAKMKVIDKGVFYSKAIIGISPDEGNHTIDGSAHFDIPNIHFAQHFIPRSRGLRGALNSKLTFSGLLAKPQIRVQATLKKGYLRLPEAGTEITNMTIGLTADKPGLAIIKGNMQMGSGVINVTGDMNLKNIANWKANIKVSGNNIRFLNTNEVKANMSPDITVNMTPEAIKISGKVVIPEADIRLKAIPESSIDESTDTFVIGETKEGKSVNSVKVKPNVLIQLGDKVKMDAFGLVAKLSGDVKISHNQKDILANGSLRVQEGKFEAYGQDLAIENGRLIFNGSPKLVGMDIRATRTIDEQVVGIHLGGNVLSPQSKIFSEPVLEESESLSYLLTGHSLSSASGQESALMLSAVRNLGITGNGSIIQKIGSSFGLDDVNIVTNSDLEKSGLELGKRLGSSLYVRYLIGLFDQAQKIAIEYKISDVLSLEAQTTTETYGMDFIYEIETD